MPSKPDCKFEPRYAENGGLFKGECACGQVFYPFSTDPKKREEALKYRRNSQVGISGQAQVIFDFSTHPSAKRSLRRKTTAPLWLLRQNYRKKEVAYPFTSCDPGHIDGCSISQ
jgi:hypothetical protein